MPDPLLPNLRRAVVSGEMSPQERWTNTFHFIDLTALTQTRATQIGTAIEEFYSAFAVRCVSYWTADTCTIYDKSEVDGPAFDAGSFLVSGSSADAAFQQIAVCVTWDTGFPGRSNRGRTYLCGIANDQFTDGDAGPLLFNDATPVDAVLDGAENMHIALGAIGVAHVVYSRVGAGDTDAIVTARVGSVPDTQRRRRNQLVETYTSRNLII